MKNLFIYAAVIAATMGSMTACSDFLDVKPVTNKQEPDFVSQEGITQLLTGMYARLNSTDANDGYFRSTLTNYVYGDVMGGDANKGRAERIVSAARSKALRSTSSSVILIFSISDCRTVSRISPCGTRPYVNCIRCTEFRRFITISSSARWNSGYPA